MLKVIHQGAPLVAKFDVYDYTVHLLPPPKKEVMFLVRSVCLSVCLSVGLLANL